MVATEIYAVEGELLATMDAVASRRVLKRDIKELTRLVLVGGERPEYGPTGIPNLDRVGSYQPPPEDYEAQALRRNADGLPGAAGAYTRIGAANRPAATAGTAKFVPAVRRAATNGAGAGSNGVAVNGAIANGTASNGHVAANGAGTTGSGTTDSGTDSAPTPPPAPPAVAPPVATPRPAPDLRVGNGPLPVSRVIDGKVVPASAPPKPSIEDDEELTGSALSTIDAETMFSFFAADAALGGGHLTEGDR